MVDVAAVRGLGPAPVFNWDEVVEDGAEPRVEDGAQPVVEDVFNWDEEEDAEPRVLTREQPFGTAAVQQAL